MRVLGPVVEILRAPVFDRWHQLPMSHNVTGELVGDQHPRHPGLLAHQLAEEAFRRLRVSAGLDQDVEDVAVLIDRPPQVLPDAADLDEYLVQKPCVAGFGSASAQATRVFGPELSAPCTDRLVRDHDTAGEHQFLDVTQAQGEPVVQPHAVHDDLRRISVPFVQRPRRIHGCFTPQGPSDDHP